MTTLKRMTPSMRNSNPTNDDISNWRLQYTRRENMKIFNVQEELEEDTEKLVRNMFITKMQISAKDVNTIRFERIHRIPTKPTSQRSQDRPRPIIVTFSHFQDKEFEKRFLKNLKGTQIGVSVDFPKEIDEIHRKLYPVWKSAKQANKRAYFHIGKEGKKLRISLSMAMLWKTWNKSIQGHPTNLFLTLSIPQRNLAGWPKYRCFDELAGKFFYW